MLTKDEIKVLIVMRLLAACDSCNKHHINRIEGQIQGLLTVLMDGKRVNLSGSCRQLLDFAEIPWEPPPEDPEGWNVPDSWLEERGCTINGNNISHPKFENW